MKIYIFQILTVPLAILSFRVIPLPYAGLVASALFITVSFYSMYWAYQRRKFKSLSLFAWACFLVFFAIPILYTRLSHLDVASSELHFLNISFDKLHMTAEKVYIVAFICSVLDDIFYRTKKAAK